MPPYRERPGFVCPVRCRDGEHWPRNRSIKRVIFASASHSPSSASLSPSSVSCGTQLWETLRRAAVIHITRQLAFEFAPGLRVNALAPGLVKTKLAAALWEAGRRPDCRPRPAAPAGPARRHCHRGTVSGVGRRLAGHGADVRRRRRNHDCPLRWRGVGGEQSANDGICCWRTPPQKGTYRLPAEGWPGLSSQQKSEDLRNAWRSWMKKTFSVIEA